MELFVNNSKIEVIKKQKIISKKHLLIIIMSTHHNCSSHTCKHSSHDGLESDNQFKEDYTSYLTTKKKIKDEELRSARKALKIKLKNKQKKRSGIDSKTWMLSMDTSGNELQSRTAKRLFIMEHLAKMRLMESLGLGHTVPSLAEILKKYCEK